MPRRLRARETGAPFDPRTPYTGLLATGRTFDLGEQRPAMLRDDLALTSTRFPNGIVTAEVARKQIGGTWLWAIDQPSISV
jgi:hypothetical protein